MIENIRVERAKRNHPAQPFTEQYEAEEKAEKKANKEYKAKKAEA